MTKTITDMVTQFHQTYGVPMPDKLTDISTAREQLRLRIDLEEFLELANACGITLYAHGKAVELADCAFVPNGNIVNVFEIADGLGDGIYVKYGHALERGIPIDKVLAEIHRSNMSKLGSDDKPIYRDDGKVLKGPNYSPPDLHSIIYGA